MWVVDKGRFNTLSHILICHHHLLCYDKCIFPVAGPACNECNAILLPSSFSTITNRSESSHVACTRPLSICCGFSRNSDYIIVTSQTVKIRHTEKLLQLEYNISLDIFVGAREICEASKQDYPSVRPGLQYLQ